MSTTEPFLIFYPPKLLVPDLTVGDSNAVLEKAKKEYLEMGVALVSGEDIKNAQKIVAFSSQFPELVAPI